MLGAQGLTFDVSGGLTGAKRRARRPLDGWVRRRRLHSTTLFKKRPWDSNTVRDTRPTLPAAAPVLAVGR